MDLGSIVGDKVVVLAFWSIYCKPCVEEISSLIRLQDEFGGSDLEVIGVNTDSELGVNRIRKFISRFEEFEGKDINYQIIFDEGGKLTTAHETGHVLALEDDYIKRQEFASCGQRGFVDFIPASPFDLDQDSIMKGNKTPRARHYWHVAEWARTKLQGDLKLEVRMGDDEPYLLPPHPAAPLQTYATDPLAQTELTPPSYPGKAFLTLTALGSDVFSRGVLGPDGPPVDGFRILEFYKVNSILKAAEPMKEGLKRGLEAALSGVRERTL